MMNGFFSALCKRSVTACAVASLLLLATSSPLHADSSAGSYHVPDFDAPVFDRDAISLQGGDRQEVVAALASLALNFPSEQHIDPDVKEKALAIALRLAPLNPLARDAHQKLSGSGQGGGDGVKPDPKFAEAFPIFEVLAKNATRMWRDRHQPDDQVLAPLLMELALTIPSSLEWDEREVQQLAHLFRPIVEESPLDEHWQKTVSIQPNAGDGASQLASRIKSLKPLASAAAPAPAPAPGNTNNSTARNPAMNQGSPRNAPGGGDADSGPPAATVKVPAAQLLMLAAISDELPAGPAAVTLSIEKMTETDVSLFGFFGTESGLKPEMLLLVKEDSNDEAPMVTGFEAAEEAIRKKYPRWPEELVGRVGFEPAQSFAEQFNSHMASLRERNDDSGAAIERPSYDVSLALAVLIEGAFSGKQAAGDVALSGRLENTGQVRSIMPLGDVMQMAAGYAERLQAVGVPVRPKDEDALKDRVVMGNLQQLVRPQLIVTNTLAEAAQVALNDNRPDDLMAAVNAFAQLSQASDLTANVADPAVQEIVDRTLERWPGHLSARLLKMAAEGGGDMTLSLAGSVSVINSALEPLLSLYDPEDDSVGEIPGVDERVNFARDKLRDSESKLHPDSVVYKLAVESVINPLRDYLKLKNRSFDNSNADQKRRELNDQLQNLQLLAPAVR